MELALYCPKFGYYERGADRVGCHGDFYTSVSTGSLFGEMLAYQFALWLEDVETRNAGCRTGGAERGVHFAFGVPRSAFQLVEGGAHDGQLALDIMNWLQRHRPHLLDRLEYWLIEPSQERQVWQRAKLEPVAGRVFWAQSLQSLPTGGVHGVIFSNELLDAFPVHRLAWDRTSRKWIEWGVGWRGDHFVWSRLIDVKRDWDSELARAGFDLTPELKAVLPDGFVIEHCPAAETWWRQAAAALCHGWLLTIDYGFIAEQFLAPGRGKGTLRAYRRHQVSGDVLANPGEQDLTAHVNFTQIQRAGEEEGLKTEGFFTQARFLTAIAGRMWPDATGALSPSQARQFQSLTHPEHLSRSFRALVQSRNR